MTTDITTLHIYNPETEYALASGSPFYTPPRSIIKLRSHNAAKIFSLIASDQDALLILDPKPTLIAGKNSSSTFLANPWGWNPQIVHTLNNFAIENNIKILGIPSQEWLDNLRSLAHRSTTIGFLNKLPSEFTHFISPPQIINNPEDAVSLYLKNNNLFFKAPWSSSGRGIMRTDDLEIKHVEPWIRGIIRAQGCVIVEPIYNKRLDFATEWIKDGDIVRFIGLSIFETSNRGKYHCQISGNQLQLKELIESVTSEFTPDLINAQREAIKSTLRGYDGPLGIDMLVTSEGHIHPCIEINLRQTMGSILIDRSLDNEKIFIP